MDGLRLVTFMIFFPEKISHYMFVSTFYASFSSYVGDASLQPVWLGGVQCLSTDDSLSSCDHADPIGYPSSCHFASGPAELDCG